MHLFILWEVSATPFAKWGLFHDLSSRPKDLEERKGSGLLRRLQKLPPPLSPKLLMGPHWGRGGAGNEWLPGEIASLFLVHAPS